MSDGPSRVRVLTAWMVFAIAFGYVEAAVVAYIRAWMGMPRGLDYPAVWRQLGLPFDGASIYRPFSERGVLSMELGREIATLALLAGAAYAAGRTAWERWGVFWFTFAVWDLSYYAWLYLFTGFPRSLAATDIYFLLPRPLYGPVWLPLVGMPVVMALSLRLTRVEKPKDDRGQIQ